LIGDNVSEKSHELRRGMSCRGLAKHLTGFGVERRVQRECAER
jgi:hypothetical protein